MQRVDKETLRGFIRRITDELKSKLDDQETVGMNLRELDAQVPKGNTPCCVKMKLEISAT